MPRARCARPPSGVEEQRAPLDLVDRRGHAGGVMTSSMSDTSKLLTPISRARPGSRASTNARHMSMLPNPLPGQWISHRSTWSVPSSSRLWRRVSSSRPARSGRALGRDEDVLARHPAVARARGRPRPRCRRPSLCPGAGSRPRARRGGAHRVVALDLPGAEAQQRHGAVSQPDGVVGDLRAEESAMTPR